MSFKTYFLVGGAGFLGSHFIDALLTQSDTQKVTVYDNFSSGREWHYQQHLGDSRFSIVRGDVKDFNRLQQAMVGYEVVMHFASNPDIARAAKEPNIDFTEGIYLTSQVLEAARITGVNRIVYMSGSGVYGDVGMLESREDHGSMFPVSTYGASKLAGEAFISSYCHMFGISACAFRCGNIVGSRQTHGVGYDFVRSLMKNQDTLTILGDGTQSKSYIHVEDVVQAVFLANKMMQNKFEIYNVATNDYISVLEIAKIIIECMDIKKPVALKFTGGKRGWKGDVPIVRLNTDKIRSLGWICKRYSAQAIKESVQAIILETAV
ncbi:MAG TPA: NAD-dependent epimerase/dehydratase family protein [Gammaproteobacteria bacterium]|nr:NAD-dependent epimerase/dehydratase family protein [Gammaproteobacteria bacterium]